MFAVRVQAQVFEVAVGAKDLQIVEVLHVEVERPLGAVDLPLERVSPAECESGRLDRADCAIVELDRRFDGDSTTVAIG